MPGPKYPHKLAATVSETSVMATISNTAVLSQYTAAKTVLHYPSGSYINGPGRKGHKSGIIYKAVKSLVVVAVRGESRLKKAGRDQRRLPQSDHRGAAVRSIRLLRSFGERCREMSVKTRERETGRGN